MTNTVDLVDSGLELLLYQFSDKFNINQLLTTYLTELDNTNQDLYTLVDSFNVNDATGVYLDYIGRLVGEKRQNDGDDDYRKRIKVRILINNSKGTPNDLLNILAELTETDNVRIWEHFPVSHIMYTDGNNATVKTLQGLKDSSPITSEVCLIVDTTRKGFVGDELLPSYPTKAKQSILAEFLSELDILIDDVGDNIVDESGNQIILYDTEGETLSYYGVFTDIIK